MIRFIGLSIVLISAFSSLSRATGSIAGVFDEFRCEKSQLDGVRLEFDRLLRHKGFEFMPSDPKFIEFFGSVRRVFTMKCPQNALEQCAPVTNSSVSGRFAALFSTESHFYEALGCFKQEAHEDTDLE